MSVVYFILPPGLFEDRLEPVCDLFVCYSKPLQRAVIRFHDFTKALPVVKKALCLLKMSSALSYLHLRRCHYTIDIMLFMLLCTLFSALRFPLAAEQSVENS